MRICDCAGQTIVGATFAAYLPAIASAAFFVLQLLNGVCRSRLRRISRLAVLAGIPVGVVALDAMSRDGALCPLCVGVWACFSVVAAATVREIVARAQQLSAVRSLASVAVLLVVGIAVAQGVATMSEPNPNCDPEGHCCNYGCKNLQWGGSTLCLPNGFDRCIDQQGPGCVWDSCTTRVYELKDCEGPWDAGQYSRKCCHH